MQGLIWTGCVQNAAFHNHLKLFIRIKKVSTDTLIAAKIAQKKHVKSWSRKKFADIYEKKEQKRKENEELFKQGKKKCSKCGEIKKSSEYYLDKRKKDGLYSKCKSCHDFVVRLWEEKNPKKKFEINKASKERNREEANRRHRERWSKDSEYREKRLIEARNWKKENSKSVQEYRKIYSSRPEKKYHRNKLRKNRLISDTAYKVEVNLRRRIIKALKGEIKSKTTMELLGCKHNEFISYIESKFEEGMSWENYGYKGWHLDHIVPCAFFDLTDPEQQKKCFHYSNLQPMWWKKNMSKGARLEKDHED